MSNKINQSTSFGQVFIDDCRKNFTNQKNLQEILKLALQKKDQLHEAFEYIHKGKDVYHLTMQDVTIYYDDSITIARAKLPPKLQVPAHNHGTWAIVGIYEGKEDNIFFKKDSALGLIEIDRKTISSGETLFMDQSTIHTITNPGDDFAYGIHIYGCDILHNSKDRSIWDLSTFKETPCPKEGVPFEEEP